MTQPDNQDILGAELIDKEVVEHIEQQRKLGAANVLSQLAMKDEEYARRQAELNGQFLVSLSASLPASEVMTRAYGRSASFLEVQLLGKGVIDSISVGLSISASGRELSDLNEYTLSRLNSYRAGTIWVERSVDDVFTYTKVHAGIPNYFALEFRDSTALVPHVIVGHKQGTGHSCDVLLMALTDLGQLSRPETSSYDTREGTIARIPLDAGQHGAAALLRWANPLIRVTMATEDFEALKELQNMLLGEGLSANEISNSHDNDEKSFILSPARVATLKVELGHLLLHPFNRGPRTIKELPRGAFKAQLLEQGGFEISPEDFLDLQVLADSHVVAAIFDRVPQFERAKDALIKQTSEDPTVAWFKQQTQR